MTFLVEDVLCSVSDILQVTLNNASG